MLLRVVQPQQRSTRWNAYALSHSYIATSSYASYCLRYVQHRLSQQSPQQYDERPGRYYGTIHAGTASIEEESNTTASISKHNYILQCEFASNKHRIANTEFAISTSSSTNATPFCFSSFDRHKTVSSSSSSFLTNLFFYRPQQLQQLRAFHSSNSLLSEPRKRPLSRSAKDLISSEIPTTRISLALPASALNRLNKPPKTNNNTTTTNTSTTTATTTSTAKKKKYDPKNNNASSSSSKSFFDGNVKIEISEDNQTTPLADLECSVERIIYRLDETGYTVCRARVLGQSPDETVVVVIRSSPKFHVGQTLSFIGAKNAGRWVRDSRNGRQYHAQTVDSVSLPTDTDAIIKYLSSAVEGVGRVTAERLVAHFGTDTLYMIENEQSSLEDVPGIGPETIRKIKKALDAHRVMKDISQFLEKHVPGSAKSLQVHADVIYKKYKKKALSVLTQNPYQLAVDLPSELGFKISDQIAKRRKAETSTEEDTNKRREVNPEMMNRTRAAVHHILRRASDEGHCYTDYEFLIESVYTFLHKSVAHIDEYMLAMIDEAIQEEARAGQIRIVNTGGEESAAREEEDGVANVQQRRVYLKELEEAERSVAKQITRLAHQKKPKTQINTPDHIARIEKNMKVKLTPDQIDAIQMVLSENNPGVSIVTGGPGVGKTMIIRALVDAFTHDPSNKVKVMLAAPTGRAAKRMEESAKHKASTLHMLLKYHLRRKKADTRGKKAKKEEDYASEVYILDEVSMIDIRLMNSFLEAILANIQQRPITLVLLGDSDQLSSLGPGNVLYDMLNSGVIQAKKLETIFRQQAAVPQRHQKIQKKNTNAESISQIVRTAHMVNTGEIDFLDKINSVSSADQTQGQPADSDFQFIEEDNPDKVIEHIIKLIKEKIPEDIKNKANKAPAKKGAQKPLNVNSANIFHANDVQILTPMRKFSLGADNLNLVVQQVINPSGPSLAISADFEAGNNNYRKSKYPQKASDGSGDNSEGPNANVIADDKKIHFRLHDRVMQLKNNYDKEIYNGDIGIINYVDETKHTIHVNFNGTIKSYSMAELQRGELGLAYSCSIHKSQGSEYRYTVVVMTQQHRPMLQRNLLYTALTRGKEKVYLIGSRRAIEAAVANNEVIERRTGLAEKIRAAFARKASSSSNKRTSSGMNEEPYDDDSNNDTDEKEEANEQQQAATAKKPAVAKKTTAATKAGAPSATAKPTKEATTKTTTAAKTTTTKTTKGAAKKLQEEDNDDEDDSVTKSSRKTKTKTATTTATTTEVAAAAKKRKKTTTAATTTTTTPTEPATKAKAETKAATATTTNNTNKKAAEPAPTNAKAKPSTKKYTDTTTSTTTATAAATSASVAKKSKTAAAAKRTKEKTK